MYDTYYSPSTLCSMCQYAVLDKADYCYCYYMALTLFHLLNPTLHANFRLYMEPDITSIRVLYHARIDRISRFFAPVTLTLTG